MKTYKQLYEDFAQQQPRPVKPKKFFKDRKTCELTPKAAEYQAAIKVWQAIADKFVAEQLAAQAANYRQRALDFEAVQALFDEQENGADDEADAIATIKRYLLRDHQKDWLREKGYSVADLLNGRYQIKYEQEIIDVFYRPWNNILQANGLERTFSDDGIGQAMLESISETFGSIAFETK